MKVSKYAIPLVVCLCLSLGVVPMHITSAKDNTMHALESISYIQTSPNISYAIDKKGTTWTCGFGQNLEKGYSYIHLSPFSFPTPSSFQMIAPSSGVYKSAVSIDGHVYTWGVNDPSGQKISSPIEVQGLTDIVSSATGSEHFLALDKNGQVWGWGSNKAGQLDKTKINTNSTYNTPEPLPGLNGVKAITAYDDYSVALKKDGTLWGWGSIDKSTTSPTLLTSGKHIVSVNMDYAKVIAINKQGEVLQWDLASDKNKPKTFKLKLPVIATDNGSNGFIYAVSSNYMVWKIDPDPQGNQPAITQINGLKQITQISSSRGFTLALSQNGTVYSWGMNDKGQLGIGDPFTSITSTPTLVQKPITVKLNNTALRIFNSPFLSKNTAYVPVRGLFEKMNATVTWDRKNKNDVSITSGTTNIRLTKGKNTAIVNGKSVPLSSPPQYVNESIFIPLRFISETIGAHVNWDSTNYTVSIDTN